MADEVNPVQKVNPSDHSLSERPLNEQTHRDTPPKKQKKVSMAVFLILPLIALGGVIAVFLTTGGGLRYGNVYPVEDLTFERAVLEEGMIILEVRNASPQAITLSQAIVNDAIWPMSVTPDVTIPRLGRATVRLPYPWNNGEAYEVTLFSSSSIPFSIEIPVAVETRFPTTSTFLSYTLIGLYVGVIPVFLGMVWLPALRTLDRKWLTFLLAMTIGLLIFLGLDTLVEALEKEPAIPGSFQGIGIIAIGAIGTFLLLEFISRRQLTTGKSETSQRYTLAYLIAIGIGIHNLGEGLAIGAAYNVGEIALGAFLVVGFIIQNITEGLGIIAPIARDRPRLGQLVIMGLIGGAPAIVGAWIGGFAPSATLSILFLAVGTGAIFQVVYEIAKMLRKDLDSQKDAAQKTMPGMILSGVVTGMLILWVTGLMIK